ncbi:MAG TPA: ABC transporter ATP-binding protein [Candidatus Acidoferrum sp.]|nr:ABC transporter ATP-binding protein [Candidatus Acidoferrum sp.]
MTTPEIPLLAVEDLSVEFRTRDGIVRALDGVSFTVGRGETVGVVGESGSGKSVTALAILGILHPAARVTSGRVVFGGLDLLRAGEGTLREYRGRELSMIFQNPRTALNPIRPVGRQIEDVLRRHANLPSAHVRERALTLLARVQIADPARAYHAYPFELSGGMCQRVMIALAVACSPSLLIADEPTTGLDVTTQAAILELIEEIAGATRMAMILITHDLALAGERAHQIVVMHAGHVVETAPTAELFASPRHPYTARLIASTPRPRATLDDLRPIPGTVPDLRGTLPPCRYRSRCERAVAVCDEPPLPRLAVGNGHTVACRVPL